MHIFSKGPDLPWHLFDHRMTTFMDKLVIIGGLSYTDLDSLLPNQRESIIEILELVKSSSGGHYEWILSEHSLKLSRSTPFTVLSVPTKLINIL